MNKAILAGVLALSLSAPATYASPAEDLKSFEDYFAKQFKDVPAADFKDGAYALDADLKEQWEAMEEFPPYEGDVDAGKELWETPLKDGKTYADCLGEVKDVRGKYPHYDAKKDDIITLEGALEACKKEHDGEGFVSKDGKAQLDKGPIVQLAAYIGMEGRGGKIDIPAPEGKAMDWYDMGKNYFYAKRGQLNMSCADCHVYNAGKHIRADLLSPALGQVTHWPVYRSAWGETRSLHNRFKGCNEQVRAAGLKPESKEYKALEYFLTYMSNGQEWNGPGSRK